jgi:hypothetical protein
MDEGLKIRIGADVSGLEKGINQATTSLNKLKPSVNQTGFALSNLSRIAQDAPFGFIAIQNNLDPLIQSFQQLKTSTGGTGNALKALAAGLAGPAGIALGFSVVASLATALIQKYGSVRNAVSELAAATDRASVRQRELNNELDKGLASQQGEISTLNNLVRVLTDSNASQLQRTNAYKELKKEYPGVLQSMTEENALTLSGGKLIAARSAQLIEYIKLKSQEAALIKLGEKASEKQIAIAREGATTLQNQNTLLNKVINSFVGQGNAALGAAFRLNQSSKEFDKAGEDVDFFAKALDNVQQKLLSFDPKLTGLDKVVPPKVSKITVGASELRVIPDRVQLDTSQFNADSEIARNFSRDNGFNVPVNLTIPQSAFDALRAFGESQYWKQIGKKTQGIINQFDNFLTPVINTAFEALGNGTNIIKAIGQSMKALVLQIGLTIAKAAILSAILNTIFPGGAAIGGSAVKGFGGIFKALLGIGQTAAPNFGGISGGGVAVNVGGQFNIRGTDLVAVVQSGNQRIGRVG